MPSKLAVTRAMPAPTTAGTAFESELRQVMWRRARAALAVGVGLSALMNVLVRFGTMNPEPLASPYTFLVPNVYLAFIGMFAIGLVQPPFST